MRNAFVQAMLDGAAKDERVALLMAEVGFSVVEPFQARFPDRFYNTGIAEQDLVTVAAGMALGGLRPVAYSMSAFLTSRAFEQIKVNVSYQDLPVVLVSVGSGLSYGELGPTHHAMEESALMRALPNLEVIFPACPEDVSGAMAHALASPHPTYISFPKAPVRPLPEHVFLHGKAVCYRMGSDGAILAAGYAAADALAAAEALAAKGVQLSVYGFHTVKPLDKAAILEAGKTGAVFVVDEHSSGAGLGGEVARVLLEGSVAPKHFQTFDLQDRYLGTVLRYSELLEEYGLSVGRLTAQIAQTLGLTL